MPQTKRAQSGFNLRSLLNLRSEMKVRVSVDGDLFDGYFEIGNNEFNYKSLDSINGFAANCVNIMIDRNSLILEDY